MEDKTVTTEETLAQAEKSAARAGKVMRGAFRVRYYQEIRKQLNREKELSPEARALGEKLDRELLEARTGEVLACYDRAERCRTAAKTFAEGNTAAGRYEECLHQLQDLEEELKSAPDLAQRLERVRDAGEKAALCRKKAAAETARSRILLALILVLAAVALYGVRTSTFHNLLGDVEMGLGLTEKAAGNYTKAYQRHKTEGNRERYLSGLYACGVKAAHRGDWEEAIDRLAVPAEEDFGDASQILTELEQRALAVTEPGERAVFGDEEWIILDRKEELVLVMKADGIENDGFQTDPGRGSAWAESSLRAYLNGEYYETSFSPEEREAIQLSEVAAEDNPVFGTSGGEDTEDRIFVMSIGEFRQYRELLNASHKSYWLRNPGHSEGTAAFIAYKNCVMDYGYEAANEHIYARPMMWIRTVEG